MHHLLRFALWFDATHACPFCSSQCNIDHHMTTLAINESFPPVWGKPRFHFAWSFERLGEVISDHNTTNMMYKKYSTHAECRTRWTTVYVDPMTVQVAKNINPNCVASRLPYNIRIALTHHLLYTIIFIHLRVIIVYFFPPSK